MVDTLKAVLNTTIDQQAPAVLNNFDFDSHFRDNYNTKLSDEDEKAFQQWAAQNPRLGSADDYDARGFWLEGAASAENGHGTDKWKKPNHPTFSTQSIYNGVQSPYGGVFEGGVWSEDGSTYTPSSTMLKYTHPLDWLRNYMEKVEPGVLLNMDNRK